METALIAELVQAVWRELIHWRKWCVALMIFTAFSILTVGVFWPEKYKTDILLHADVTNIIQPLLQGQAEVTKVDRSKEAKELIYTRRILSQVAESVGLIGSLTSEDQQQAILSDLRSKISIANVGKNYFRVNYIHESPDQSFRVLNAVVDAFISYNSEKKRSESRGAYEFIEQQAEAYKRQLVIADEQLKNFKSKNLDGTEEAVSARISQLRLDIEELKLTIDEVDAKRRSLQAQLKSESKYLDTRDKVDEERERLAVLKKRLDTLRLSYQETYPDIVSLKEQVKAQELAIQAMQGKEYVSARNSESVENPLFEDLRIKAAESEVELNSQKRRLEAMKRMLQSEYERAERIASRNAELSELVRDYDVTRQIYEEMLERKEKARLSMTLDIEGQGVSYRIQEPAVYPLKPAGLQFLHFALLAPVVAFLLPLCLVVAYVFLDPRVRSAAQLTANLPSGVEVLAVIPHVNTSLVRRLQRVDIIALGALLLVALVVYVAVVYAKLSGGFL